MKETDEDKRLDRADRLLNGMADKLATIGFEEAEICALLILYGLNLMMEGPCPGCLVARLEHMRGIIDERIGSVTPAKQHHH